MNKYLGLFFGLLLFTLTGCEGFYYYGPWYDPSGWYGGGYYSGIYYPSGWYYGGYHSGGWSRGHRGGPGGHGGHHFIPSLDDTAIDSSGALVAAYAIKIETAYRILNFAENVDKTSAAKELGVSVLDLAPLAKFQMPSEQTVQTIAIKLGEDSSKIQQMLQDFISDIEPK